MSQTTVQLVTAVIGAGGLLTGIVAFLKLRPENDSVVVTAAQGALLVQSGVVDELKEELGRAKQMNIDQGTEIIELRREVREMRRDLRAVTDERDALRTENTALRLRVDDLEGRLAKVEGDG